MSPWSIIPSVVLCQFSPERDKIKLTKIILTLVAILTPTVVDAVHIVGSDVWNGLPQVVEGFLRKRICNLNRVCSGRHGFLTRTNPVLAIKVEAGFSLKGNSNGSLLVLKLNFQDASFTCLDSSYCVSPAFLDVVYGGEVAQFSLCRLAMVAHVAVVAHVVGCAVVLCKRNIRNEDITNYDGP